MSKRVLKVTAFLSLYFISSLNLYSATADELEEIRSKAIAENTYYSENTNCHGEGINAELQELVGTVWKKVAPALGWIKVKGCDAEIPLRPWTKAEVAEGTELRWRTWVDKEFEWTSEVFFAQKKNILSNEASGEDTKQKAAAAKAAEDAAAKAANDKALQEAAAKAAAAEKAAADAAEKAAADKAAAEKAAADKAAADKAAADKAAADKAAADKAAAEAAVAEAKAASAKKKTTITCVKGKTVKKVTAANPKCAKGYKKK